MILIKRIKKISFLLVLIVLFNTFLTGCNSDKNPHSEIKYTNVYKTKYLEMPDGYRYRDNKAYIADDKIYVKYSKPIILENNSDDNSRSGIVTIIGYDNVLYIYDINGEVSDIINLNSEFSSTDTDVIIPANDGTFYAVNAKSLINITVDGEVLWNVSFADAFNVPANPNLTTPYTYIDNEKGYMYISDEIYIYIFTLEGKPVHCFKLADYIKNNESIERVNSINKTPDGKVIINCYNTNYNIISNNRTTFYEMDADKKTITEYKMPASDNIAIQSSYYTYFDYLSGYDIYYKNEYGLYGHYFDDTEPELLINWTNSDVYGSYCDILSVITPEIVFCALYDENERFDKKPALLIHIPDDEVTPKTIITIAATISPQLLTSIAVKFNKQSEKYRVVIDDYSIYNTTDNWNHGTDLFNLDITSGVVHDMIFLNNSMPIDSYVKKGMFVDLYEFFDKDPDISKDNLLGILKSIYETGGKLYILPLSYLITTLLGKASLVGSDEKLTVDEIIRINDNLPNDVSLFTFNGRINALYDLLRVGASEYIDYQTAKCNFTSDNFIKMIKFVKTLPETALTTRRYLDALEMLDTIRNNRSYFYELSIIEMLSFFNMEYYYGEDDYVIKGFPNQTGNGSIVECYSYIGISNKCQNKEGAWEFIKYWLSDKVQTSQEIYFMPVTNTALKTMLDKYKNDYYYYIDNNTGRIIRSNIYYSESDRLRSNYEEYHFTEENNEKIIRFFNNLQVTPKYDNTIINIIAEEVSAFFADNITAEQCAKYIQNRVSTYLNEQK